MITRYDLKRPKSYVKNYPRKFMNPIGNRSALNYNQDIGFEHLNTHDAGQAGKLRATYLHSRNSSRKKSTARKGAFDQTGSISTENYNQSAYTVKLLKQAVKNRKKHPVQQHINSNIHIPYAVTESLRKEMNAFVESKSTNINLED